MRISRGDSLGIEVEEVTAEKIPLFDMLCGLPNGGNSAATPARARPWRHEQREREGAGEQVRGRRKRAGREQRAEPRRRASLSRRGRTKAWAQGQGGMAPG